MLYQRYRYSQWDGTQQIFDVDASEVMDALSDDLLGAIPLGVAVALVQHWRPPDVPAGEGRAIAG